MMQTVKAEKEGFTLVRGRGQRQRLRMVKFGELSPHLTLLEIQLKLNTEAVMMVMLT